MAINVPMTAGPDGSYPLPFPGETFLLTRDKISLSFKDNAFNVSGVNGRLFMTNMRMVFRVADNHTAKAHCETLEMPFRGFWDEKLHQPIFGTNNLTGTLMYYDNQPFQGNLTVKLIFNEGGVGTFLAVFNNVLRATRIQMNRERISNNGANPAPIPVNNENPSAPPPEASRYMPSDAAFVDPNDPSQIYTTTQPDINLEERREEQPAWAPSGGGMRRRRQ